MTRIALIHATPVAVAPIADAFQRLWPDAETANLLDDSLSTDLSRTGRLDGAMTERFRRLARYAADTGADAILFTCSAFGPCIEAAAADLAPMPVLKPNEAMFADALAMGSRIGMITTFQPSVASMEAEFRALTAATGASATIETVCAPDAMPALAAGDAATHDRLIAEAAAGMPGIDALVLAQFSMARAAAAAGAATDAPVLTSPDSVVRRLRREVGIDAAA